MNVTLNIRVSLRAISLFTFNPFGFYMTSLPVCHASFFASKVSQYVYIIITLLIQLQA